MLKDLHGFGHILSRQSVEVMLGVGWTSFMVGLVLNIIYYAIHPSEVDMSIGNKLRSETYIFGEKRKLPYLYAANQKANENCDVN